jgi:rhomboid family GlyGly-CTERM serine protease
LTGSRALQALRTISGSRAWAGLAAALGALALFAWPVEHAFIDWQPALVLTQPWRAWTAVAVHYSALHLGANLLGTLLVGTLGVAAHLPGRMVWAWAAAWPITHWGLLIKPELLHYGGLSGVLHGGVAVAALHLVLCGRRSQRWIGAAILFGVVVKVVGESPWGEPLRRVPSWDIAIAPIAHATGLAAGLLCAGAAHALSRRVNP